jgi:FkbM family methyltransferase
MKPILIDAGACVGRFLEPYLLTHSIIAIEPYSANYQSLTAAFRGKGHDMQCLNAALTKQPGMVTFYCPDGGHAGYEAQSNTMMPTNCKVSPGCRTEQVMGITLSSILGAITGTGDYIVPEVDVLKLDIEGAEYDVFDDIFENNLLPRIKSIYVEFHAGPCKMGPAFLAREAEIIDRMKREFRGSFYVWNWSAGRYDLRGI